MMVQQKWRTEKGAATEKLVNKGNGEGEDENKCRPGAGANG